MYWALVYVLGGSVLYDTELRFQSIEDCTSSWVEARKAIDGQSYASDMDSRIVDAGYCLPAKVPTNSVRKIE